MLFDTDVLIWYLRGNPRASRVVDANESRSISVVTFMELVQGARGKHEVKAIKGFLANMDFRTLPLTENIGHRASIYMEEYALAAGISMADSLLAATAVESHEAFLTGNHKHYKHIQELDLRVFRP